MRLIQHLGTMAVATMAFAINARASEATGPARAAAAATTAELFSTTKVWSIHLTFTREEWAAMEPAQAPSRGLGPGGFGPAMFIAPSFLKQGDADQDGTLSRAEFQDLGEKWFTAWDKAQSGELNSDEVRDGLNASFASADSRPGQAGRPDRMPGLMLLGAEGKRNGLASAMGIEFAYVRADLDFDGQSFKDVAVRYKGNGTFLQSRATLKRSLKIDLNEHVKGQKLAGVSTLNLHSNVTDASWMNEVLSYRLYREAGVAAPRTSYARVRLTVPGKYDKEYLGLYSLVEDVGKGFAEENFGTRKGVLLKPVTSNLFADLGDDWRKYHQIYDPKEEISAEEAQRVIEFARLVTKADDATFASQLSDYLDLDQFARYMAVTVWLSTMDGILSVGQNFYVHFHPKTKKFAFVPWDLDHSFGQFPLAGSQEQRENLSIHKPWRGENRFLDRVFKVEQFKTLYLRKLAEFSTTIFQSARFSQQVEEIAAAIRAAVKDESEEKLTKFEKTVAGEPLRGGGFGPAPAEPMKPIRTFVKARAESVGQQLAGLSEGLVLDAAGPVGRPPPGARGGFGAGMFLGPAFMKVLDADQDQRLPRGEFTNGFVKWFDAWNIAKTGVLSDEELRAGINRDFAPPAGAPPGTPAPLPFGGPARAKP